ncbi:MAG: DUF1858 domain-containing protein [Candidatus Limiplasma sp.]|nr:DUF1858 domain-containing protein [Candidatus Limiplasma sp.]
MEERVLDLDKTVYALCSQDPQVAEILREAGFSEITKPGMLTTVGRVMTIPKGAAMRHVELEEVKRLFESHGYRVTGGGLS